MLPKITILVIGLFACACTDHSENPHSPAAGVTAETAKAAATLNSPAPDVFNEETAMRAIYGDYNAQRKGSLGVDDGVETLATAILVRTYVEASINKGVLAVQMESFDKEGRSLASHADGADISVYVFQYNGAGWAIEKTRKTVTNAGSFGQAPAARLIKLGAEKYGLLFEDSYQQMGYESTDIFIVGISEPEIGVILEKLEMSGDNQASDICIEDESEKKDPAKCWEYRGELNFFEKPGSDYYLIEHKLSGAVSKDGSLISMDGIKYYEKSIDGYRLSASQQRPETTPMSLEQVLVP